MLRHFGRDSSSHSMEAPAKSCCSSLIMLFFAQVLSTPAFLLPSMHDILLNTGSDLRGGFVLTIREQQSVSRLVVVTLPTKCGDVLACLSDLS